MENNVGSDESGRHACASCKHQRKRCGPECILAPYFPATRSRQFRAVQKVFGVSNVSKMIKSIPTHEERSHAAQSMVWEAEWRIKSPVSGCYGEYLRLRRDLDLLCAAWCNNMHHHNINSSNDNDNNNILSMAIGINDGCVGSFHVGEHMVVNPHEGHLRIPTNTSMNRLNPQYYFPQDQFYERTNSKAMEDAWRGGLM